MFTIPSLGKILVLVAVIVLVWYGFKLVSRLDQARKQELRRQEAGPAKPRPGVEETVRCPVCDAFVASRGATSCGRPDCPY